MNKSIISYVSLFLFTTLLVCVYSEELSKEEIIALSRDHNARMNPDELLNGFIPVWPIVIYIIAAFSLVTAVFTFACYLFGCRNPHKHIYQSAAAE